MSESEWSFRLATPEDAEAFAQWVKNNPLIDPQDVQDGLNKNNPTAITFVACFNGVPVVFAPMFATLHLAHLGFCPDADGATRKEALSRLMTWVGAFAVQMGIRTITTLSKEKYPVARWAKQHGFEVDPRQLFKWDLREWMKKGK